MSRNSRVNTLECLCTKSATFIRSSPARYSLRISECKTSISPYRAYHIPHSVPMHTRTQTRMGISVAHAIPAAIHSEHILAVCMYYNMLHINVRVAVVDWCRKTRPIIRTSMRFPASSFFRVCASHELYTTLVAFKWQENHTKKECRPRRKWHT